MIARVLLTLIYGWTIAQSEKPPPPPPPLTVKLGQGTVTGKRLTAPSGRTVTAFLGVQFAQAPKFENRFAVPQALQQESAAAARVPSPTCMHSLDVAFEGFAGSEMWNGRNLTENCLSLNLWVPSAGPRFDGTVMVWIFGGGFFSGSPSLDLYDGATLADEAAVIVVNLNYRLGPFGFLYLSEMSSVSGNMGLLDQQLALKWVQENVGRFGGRPETVTLFGESSGAASVSAHLLSATSRRLFSRAILQSGAILNMWASATPREMRARSMALARRLGCSPRRNDAATASCLRLVDDHKKIQAESAKLDSAKFMEFNFVPVSSADAFFGVGGVCASLEQLARLETERPIDVLVGTNADEGSYWLPYYLKKHGFAFDHRRKAESAVNAALIGRRQYESAAHAVFASYLRGSGSLDNLMDFYAAKFGGRYRDAVSRFVGDFFFTCDVLRFADALTLANVSLYSYYFTQRWSTANPWPKWMGVMHGYEIEYVFGVPLRKPNQYTTKEAVFSRSMMTLWSDFARHGRPRDDWPPYKAASQSYVELNADLLSNTNSHLVVGKQLRSQSCKLLRKELVTSLSCETQGSSSKRCRSWLPAAVTLLTSLTLRLVNQVD